MDNGIEDFEEREVTTEDILNGIKSISPIEWEGANYPIISYANRKFLGIEDNEAEKSLRFWKEVLNPEHFLNVAKSVDFDPNENFLFIIHTFKDSKGDEVIIKVITTTPESFVEDPGNMINYSRHGFPCENRGGGRYPTLNNFWVDFYDKLSSVDMDKYPILTRDWKKSNII